jgi:peptide/nickel transport system substrate-binding protein
MVGIRKICFISLLIFCLAFSMASIAAAKDKNIVNIFMWEINDWDPAICYSDGARILANIYETLLRYDDGKLIPVLATSYEKSQGGKVWTFKLRQGAKFHNGEPFNAQAVKYSFERLVKMGKGAAWIFEPIKEIKVVDDYTVQFICEDPLPVDLMVTSYYGAWIVPPKLSEEKGSDWYQKGNACGTGPYKLKSYEKGVGAVLEKFDDYWGGWKPNQYDFAIYKIVAESSTAIQLLKRGEMDFIEVVPMELRDSLAKHPDIEVVYGDSMMNLYYHLHNQKAPTDDINVRKAICHAVNVEELVEQLMGDSNIKAVGPIPYSMWGYNPNLKGYEYDLEKAKAYMKKSKYAEQLKKGPLKLTISSYEEDALVWASYIQAALKKIGIEADIDATPWPAGWDTYKNKEKCPQMTMLHWWGDYPTPNGWFYGNWFVEEEPLFGWAYYGNPKLEEMVNEAYGLEATDRKKAEELYKNAQQIILDDAASLFIADYKSMVFKRKEIKGYRHLPLYNGAYWIYDLHK